MRGVSAPPMPFPRAEPAVSEVEDPRMADLLKFATAAARPRDPDGFVMTETAEDILRSLELVRAVDGTAMTMIAGAPGVGKTRAVHRF